MNKSSNYQTLMAWKEGIELVNEIYSLTQKFPNEERYGLISQMRRSAIIVPSNIAEGCGRQHKKETIHFFHIAKGSLYELETQLYISEKQGIIGTSEFERISGRIINCIKLIQGFINYKKN